jgi:hypothetical protein
MIMNLKKMIAEDKNFAGEKLQKLVYGFYK